MTIEEFFIDYLTDELPPLSLSVPFPVSGSVPHPMPAEFVTVELTGGSESNLIPTAQIHVQSWSSSRAAAAALNATVVAAMLASAGEQEISSISLTACYNNPDLATHKPRYSAAFEVVYLI